MRENPCVCSQLTGVGVFPVGGEFFPGSVPTTFAGQTTGAGGAFQPHQTLVIPAPHPVLVLPSQPPSLPPPPPPPPPPAPDLGSDIVSQLTVTFGQLFTGQGGEVLTIPLPQPQPVTPPRLPTFKGQPLEILRLPTLTQDLTVRQFRPSETIVSVDRAFIPAENFPQGQTTLELTHGGDSERVRDEIRRGKMPQLTGADPPTLPDLDLLESGRADISTPGGEGLISALRGTDSEKPCLSCQMSDSERAALIESMPPDAVEVSFLCPSADDAEKLSVGQPNGCIPN